MLPTYADIERAERREHAKRRMVHYAETCCDPHDKRALCGAPLTGTPPPGFGLDCVVCAEIASRPTRCIRCGSFIAPA